MTQPNNTPRNTPPTSDPRIDSNFARPDSTQQSIAGLQAQIEGLRAEMHDLIRRHEHNGLDSLLIGLDTDIDGIYETVSAAPTNVPRNTYDQIKIYVNSTTYRLYWYDGVGNVWHYVTATA